MQVDGVEESFTTYPLTDEKVEFAFEKMMFNKKDRYFNSEKRITAMRALMIGPFIHSEPKPILKIMRYIAAVAQTTTNSTEKA